MPLLNRHLLRFDADLLQAAGGNQRFFGGHLAAFDQRRHGDQTRSAEDDPEHGQERTELVRPDFLEPDADGAPQVHGGESSREIPVSSSSPASLRSTFLAMRPSRI